MSGGSSSSDWWQLSRWQLSSSPCSVTGGSSPRSLTKLYVAPLSKPNRYVRFSGPKRLISRMSVSAKLFEAAVLHRLLPLLGRTFEGKYRGRGAEFHPAQYRDPVRADLAVGRYGNLAAVDINGAYDDGDLSAGRCGHISGPPCGEIASASDCPRPSTSTCWHLL